MQICENKKYSVYKSTESSILCWEGAGCVFGISKIYIYIFTPQHDGVGQVFTGRDHNSQFCEVFLEKKLKK